MKQNVIHFFILIILLIFYSCSDEKLKYESLTGNWFFIRNDSLYNEVYIDSISFLNYLDGDGLFPQQYKIVGQKIMFYSVNNSDTIYNKNFIPTIRIYNRDSFALINNEEELLYKRINGSKFTIDSILNENDLKKYRNYFYKRKLRYLLENNLIDSSEYLNFRSFEVEEEILEFPDSS